MTSPTPIDGLVWSYHQLGWSTRRIAGEVQTSQATVVRILERLKKDPPPGDTVVLNSTPPGGLSAVQPLPPSWSGDDDTPPPVTRRPPRGNLVLTVINLILMGVLAATLAAAAGGLIARGQPGPRGPAGPAGPGGPAGRTRDFTLCVHTSQFTGSVVSLSAPDAKGSCGNGTLIRLPG